MKTLPLAKDAYSKRYSTFTHVSDKDLPSLSKWKWRVLAHGYVARKTRVKGKYTTFYLHRFIMNAKKGEMVDHKNGNKLDNRRCNLRITTNSQNQMNSAKRKASSIYKGVVKTASGWKAQICKNGVNYLLGQFPTERQAAIAYDFAARDLFGKYARLNFPNAIC